MMVLYRCFFLSEDDRICAVVELDSDDDEAALAQARQIFAAQDEYPGFELWAGGRYVHTQRGTQTDDG
jgi:hypothetical protein